MSEANTEVQPPKNRLQLLQEQIEEEQKRQTVLHRAQADKLAAEAAELRRKAEERTRAEYEARQARLAEASRKAQEIADAKAETERLEKAKAAELERQAEIQREAIRESELQRKAEREMQARLFALEQENARIEKDIQQASQPKPEAAEPVTIRSPKHPLSRIFNRDAENVTTEPSQGLTSLEQAAIQREADREFEAREAAQEIVAASVKPQDHA